MEQSLLFVQTPVTVVRRTDSPVHARRSLRATPQVSRRTVCMAETSTPTSYEDYVRIRNTGKYHGGTMKDAERGLLTFLAGGGDSEFDGGDSGGGVVGDGNMDLEDQHNSTEMLRDGFLEEKNLEKTPIDRSEMTGKVKSATTSRTASSGGNYFGRFTGYAAKKIEEITEEDRKYNRLDEVRAQQLENWHNQRALHASRHLAQDGSPFTPKPEVSFNESINYKMALGKPTAEEAKAKAPVKRRDGKEWGEVKAAEEEEVTETFEVKTRINATAITEIDVKNLYIRFMPFRCTFTDDSDPSFSVEPTSGTMERSTGPPVKVVVRYTPTGNKGNVTGTLVFETEEFKFVYKFIGST